ncbi:MAG: hypothetical protein IPG61_18855 [bacterium]|nr:hypothetical protein [bacterium]
MTGFVLEQAKRAWHETGTPFWGLLDFTGRAQAESWAAWIRREPAQRPAGLGRWSMWVCALVYVAVSLGQQLVKRRVFDLDRLLHRGKVGRGGRFEGTGQAVSRGWRAIGITDEFGRRDKFLYVMTWSWNLAWMAVFAVGTIFFLSRRLTDGGWSTTTQWLRFWHALLDRDRLVAGDDLVHHRRRARRSPHAA